MQDQTLDITTTLEQILADLSVALDFVQHTYIQIGTYKFSLFEMFATALALALIICNLLPNHTFEDDVTEDDATADDFS